MYIIHIHNNITYMYYIYIYIYIYISYTYYIHIVKPEVMSYIQKLYYKNIYTLKYIAFFAEALLVIYYIY